jgi:hypothetical protein
VRVWRLMLRETKKLVGMRFETHGAEIRWQEMMHCTIPKDIHRIHCRF